MEIRMYEKSDYENLAPWWKAHGWSPVPKDMLPKSGAIVSHKGNDIAAAWLYMSNSNGVCWLDWFVGNPEAGMFDIVKGHKMLVARLKELAVSLNYGVMLTFCRQESMVKLCKKAGFEITDEGVTVMISSLTPKGK